MVKVNYNGQQIEVESTESLFRILQVDRDTHVLNVFRRNGCSKNINLTIDGRDLCEGDNIFKYSHEEYRLYRLQSDSMMNLLAYDEYWDF